MALAYRIVGLIGCWLVAWTCVDKALGNIPQTMFAPDHIWLWWFAVAGWIINGLGVVFGGRE